MKHRREFIKDLSLAAGFMAVSPRLPGQTKEIAPPLTLAINEAATSSYLRRQIGKNTLIQAVATTLDPDSIDPDSDLFVYAYELTVKGTLRLPGRNVFIHARKIIVEKDAQIDVSGDNAETSPGGRATDGASAGAGGSTGKTGANGQNAGHIQILAEEFSGQFLTLVGRGTNGANGQPGGNGYTGADGRPGGDSENGFDGGAGGNGGSGGNGGNGGNMGTARIEAVDLQNCSVTFVLAAGVGGAPAAGGKGADGGKGGKGGARWSEGH